MADYQVSYRYASSLLSEAEDNNSLDTISKSIEIVKEAIEQNDDLQNLLENPIVKPKVKLSILNEIFKNNIDDESLKFLNFVVEKNRENFLYSIVKEFLKLRDEKLGIINVEVKTAFEFNEKQRDQLRKKLENVLNKKIRFKFEIDKSIIGGFVAKADDTVYDASIIHQLGLLKKQFLKGGIPLN